MNKRPDRGNLGFARGGIFEGDLEDAQNYQSDNEKFKQRYKTFYSDIKLSHKEDW